MGSSRVSRSRFSERAQLEAAHVGQHPVDEDQIGAAIRQGCAGGTAVLRFAHFETVTLETERDHFTDRPLVFDYQDLFCGHARPGCWGARVLQWRLMTD